MKERYIDLMERALSAYSDDPILLYFAEVREKGLTEHGFPRLTANIGILAAHGRRTDLIPVFRQNMPKPLPVSAPPSYALRIRRYWPYI